MSSFPELHQIPRRLKFRSQPADISLLHWSPRRDPVAVLDDNDDVWLRAMSVRSIAGRRPFVAIAEVIATFAERIARRPFRSFQTQRIAVRHREVAVRSRCSSTEVPVIRVPVADAERSPANKSLPKFSLRTLPLPEFS